MIVICSHATGILIGNIVELLVATCDVLVIRLSASDDGNSCESQLCMRMKVTTEMRVIMIVITCNNEHDSDNYEILSLLYI